MLYQINEPHASLIKPMFISVGGLLASVAVFFQPLYIYIAICIFAKIVDIAFAVRLSKRIKRVSKNSSGKFKSKEINKFFLAMFCFISLLLLCFLLDSFVVMYGMYPVTRFACGVFVFQQIWSCLESESSANDSKWARTMQKIMIDKSERHFDIDLSEYKKDKHGDK